MEGHEAEGSTPVFKVIDQLVVRLKRPVLSDDGVTEITDFLEHGIHEGGAKMSGVVLASLTSFFSDEL